jgi:threonine/homoserine/homoserine lactone efflux protein
MDWFGVFLLVVGLWLVSRAISSIMKGTSTLFWNLLWLAGGGYVLYLGYQKVTAPAPGLLSPVIGGRR